jgi:hypothetical protein
VAKPSAEQWAKARALYESNKSLREIGTELSIPYKTIDNRAKKEAWVRGVLAQLITDTVRVKEQFGTLGMAQQQVVSKEVETKIRNIASRDDFVTAAFSRLNSEIKVCDTQLIKPIVDAHDKLCVTAEIAPRFNPSAAQTVNNIVNAAPESLTDQQILDRANQLIMRLKCVN